MNTNPYLRHLWSHETALHRLAVRAYNFLMRNVPFSFKYAIGRRLRRSKPPYCFLQEGDTAVQVGAPSDTLLAGRSRAMYFSLFVGNSGRVVIVEPDEENVRRFRAYAKANGRTNLVFCPVGAWREEGTLKLYVDPNHPATNFSEGSKDYDEKRSSEYRVVPVKVDTIDRLLSKLALDRVRMVSLTTNGAEREILQGMKQTLAGGLPYVSLARTGEGYRELMSELGYDLVAHDDRGFTFFRRGVNGEREGPASAG